MVPTLVPPAGLEPATSGIEAHCSIQLSYRGASARLERETGIEPAYQAWKARTLPLCYSRLWTPQYVPKYTKCQRTYAVFYHDYSGMIAFIAGGRMVGQRGTALLMTMILITVIGSIAFGVGRTTLSNLRQVNRLEDSLNAYQAAQAGIEDALLRFRFDKNAEAPRAASCASPLNNNPVLTASTAPSNIFSRTDVSLNTTSCTDLTGSVEAPNPADIVYDLKMYYRKDTGQSECIVSTSPPPVGCNLAPGGQPALPSETTLEYNVQGVSLLHVSAEIGGSTPRLEIIRIGSDGTILDQDLLVGPTINDQVINLNSATQTIRMRSFGDVSSYKLSIAPQESLDSRITTIESVGYFGTSKRKLTLTLDRLTGSVFGVFDFVLFSGNGSIVGPNTP